jgi:hypothetical protein
MVSGAVSGWVNIPTRISAFLTQQSVFLIFSRSHHIKIATEEKRKDRVIWMWAVAKRNDQGQRPGAETRGRDRGQMQGANAGGKRLSSQWSR